MERSYLESTITSSDVWFRCWYLDDRLVSLTVFASVGKVWIKALTKCDSVGLRSSNLTQSLLLVHLGLTIELEFCSFISVGFMVFIPYSWISCS